MVLEQYSPGKTEMVLEETREITSELSGKIDNVMRDGHSGKLCVRPPAAGEVELR